MDMKTKNDLEISSLRDPNWTEKTEAVSVVVHPPYNPPTVTLLSTSNVESGTTTNLAENSGGVWAVGS